MMILRVVPFRISTGDDGGRAPQSAQSMTKDRSEARAASADAEAEAGAAACGRMPYPATVVAPRPARRAVAG